MKSGGLPEMAIFQDISGEIDSSSKINRLSGELNQRITQEMNSVSLQILGLYSRAISEAINEQVLPQKGWNVSTERPEYISEGNLNRKIRSSSRDEFPRNPVFVNDEEDTHYT